MKFKIEEFIRKHRKYAMFAFKPKPCTDHLGNKFESQKAMAEFYHIPTYLLTRRLKRGWNIKDVLTTPTAKSKV